MGDVVRLVREGKFVGWYIRYKDADGRRKMRASHQPSKEAARRYLLEVEGRVARGAVGIPEPAPPVPTVAELFERFLVEYTRPKIKNIDRYRGYVSTGLRRVLPVLGSKRADAVQSTDIDRLRDRLRVEYAQNTVRLTLCHLGTVYSWAKRRGIVPQNPTVGVERPAATESIEYLTRDEARRLLEVAEAHAQSGDLSARCLHVSVVVALYTGLRKGELLGLRWQDIDLERGRLTVARSYRTTPKSGKPRHLRLPAPTVSVLTAWRPSCPRTSEGLVLPQRKQDGAWGMPAYSNYTLGLPELLEAAGCRPLVRPWHALRHTMASHFVMGGGNILALQKILGHADLQMTLVYSHLAPDFLDGELDRIRY